MDIRNITIQSAKIALPLVLGGAILFWMYRDFDFEHIEKVLAEEMFDSAEALIRLDMTEYMEKHAIAKMIGSPPGYVGYDEAGQLTEKVRRRPYSVVLFDEIEKAHPDIMNLLLQILDEGRLNDAHGRSISFENTIIVMTSNAGSTDKSTGMGFNKTEGEISREKALKALRDFLRPEFIGRVDEVVVFRPLTVTDFADIAGLMLSEMAQALEEKEVKLDVTRAALEEIAKEAFGKPYGARDLRRVIRQKVEDPVAELLLRHSGYVEKLSVDVLDGALHVSEVVEVKTN